MKKSGERRLGQSHIEAGSEQRSRKAVQNFPVREVDAVGDEELDITLNKMLERLWYTP